MQRLILFFVGIPLFFAVVVFLPHAGHAAAVACVLVVNFGSALELAGLFKARGYPVKPALFGAIGIVVPLLAWAGSLFTGIGAMGLLGLGIALLAIVLFSPFAFARKDGIESALPLAASYGFVLVYPGLMGACIVLIAAEPHYAVQSLISFAALTFGNTGFAYPAALGAQLGCPDAPVVAIVGDGAWGMSLHEVSTAVEHNLPVVACVFRNMWWGAEAKNQIDFYNNRFVGVDIPTPESFVPVAQAMGAEGVRVDRPEDIREAFDACLKSRKPTVLEFVVDGTQLAPPFRKDALALPTRLLKKYDHLDYRNW